ncbi:MAG: VOC family protein [Planctomycetes bacterium]|nr:VOC family protein [Planctomycetota bacterium]
MTEPAPSLFPNALSLTVANVPRSIEFYKQKLGFKLAECFPDKKRPCWANLVLGGQSLMLGELPSLAEARQLGMGAEEIDLVKQDARAFARGAIGVGAAYYLLVADVDALARRLKKKRVKLLTPPKDQFYGIRELRVADPDGYRLVFYQPIAHACDGTCSEHAGAGSKSND